MQSDAVPVADRGLRGRLVGDSRALREVLDQIARYSACDVPVLIEGETGTGKELAARAVHYLSKRRGGPFVPVNFGALPETLVVNELFGHERGAFTGARGRSGGLIEEARGGTIFLDEIDSLPLTAQSTLLRFLQDNEYRPLGGGPARHADVRVVSASNAGIAGLVEDGRFREDLYYRLDVLGIRLPALRERADDILLLANHILTHLRQQNGGPPRMLSAGAKAALMHHDWPGNVRELENRLQRAFLVRQGKVLVERDLDLPEARADERDAGGSHGTFAEAKARAISQFEHDYLRRVLLQTRGNVSAASRIANKERRTFTRLLQKYGIDRQAYVAPGPGER